MTLDTPFRLGPFIIDADGRLTPSGPDLFPSFRIAWRGHVVLARMTAVGPDGGTLGLQAILGRIPSTGRGEGTGIQPRQAAFAALRALPSMMPTGWKVGLRPDHRIVTEAQINLPLPTSAENLVTELTLYLLRLAPYFDLLDEGVGIEFAGHDAAAAGSAPN